MPHEPISTERATELIKSGRVYRSCCGTDPDTGHIPECVHFRAVPALERPCGSCNMIGFHHADCPERGEPNTINPKHYRHTSGIETIEVGRCMTFTAGSAFKYLVRYEDKQNPAEDLKKCRWHVADIAVHDDPIWINLAYKNVGVPLLERMLDHERNVYRIAFFNGVLDLDIDAMAAAVDEARESLQVPHVYHSSRAEYDA